MEIKNGGGGAYTSSLGGRRGWREGGVEGGGWGRRGGTRGEPRSANAPYTRLGSQEPSTKWKGGREGGGRVADREGGGDGKGGT